MTEQKQPSDDLFSAAALEARLRALAADLRGRWEAVRFGRALSWLKRSESAEDPDVRFILLWVVLDSLFGQEEDIQPREGNVAPRRDEAVVRAGIPGDVAKFMGEDVKGIVWEGFHRQREAVARILRNIYIYQPFWRVIAESGVHSRKSRESAPCPGVGNIRHKFARDNNRVLFDWLAKNSPSGRREVARTVFLRLATLRNQLMHGASAHLEEINRTQVEDGCRLLSELVPRILHVMMESPDKTRGVVAYPPYGKRNEFFDDKFKEDAFHRALQRTVGRL